MNGTAATKTTGTVTGGVRTLLRLEGLTLFAGMTLLYAVSGGSWWIYAILFLAPDLSFAGYLAGPKAGAIVYNAAHSYHGADGADGRGLCACVTACAFDRDDLAGAYRLRPRARLWPEILSRFRLHPSRPDREGCDR